MSMTATAVKPQIEHGVEEPHAPDGWVKPRVRVVGEDGNAFAILGRCARAMKNTGATNEQVKEFTRQATAGDYNHLLRTTMEWVEDVGEDPPESDEDGVA
jgi:hypothetical protein